MRRVYLGLGSNLGDRAANLARAAQLLNSDRLRVVRASSVYETAPRDFLHQPHFLNQVLEADTDLLPLQLLARVKAVERRMGRRKTIDKGPRLIDVDILLYAGVVLETPQLTLPHAALPQRRFVLEPLAELAPELRHPVQGKTMRELLEGVRTQAVRRIAL